MKPAIRWLVRLLAPYIEEELRTLARQRAAKVRSLVKLATQPPKDAA